MCISVHQYCVLFYPDTARKFSYKCLVLTTAAYTMLNIAFLAYYFAVRSQSEKPKTLLALNGLVFVILPTCIQVILMARVRCEVSRVAKLSQSDQPAEEPQSPPQETGQPQDPWLSGMDTVTSLEARRNQRQQTVAVCHVVLWSFIAFGVMALITIALIDPGG
jgi:hypothetical protein